MELDLDKNLKENSHHDPIKFEIKWKSSFLCVIEQPMQVPNIFLVKNKGSHFSFLLLYFLFMHE